MREWQPEVADQVYPRSRPDACPGALTTHDAADGQLVRVRVPGGYLVTSQFRELADCAQEYGDGELHLTSRANIQLRGLVGGTGIATRFADAGLLPSPSHERVRNIIASPLSGLTGGLTDVRPLAGALDAAICARGELTTLPGRFLFGLDDGRGDIADARIDVCWRALDARTGALLLAGRDSGVRVPAAHAVDALVEAAVAFTTVRGSGEQAAWQVRELGADRERIADAVGETLGWGRGQRDEWLSSRAASVGLHPQDGGGFVAVVGLVLGALSSEQARLLAERADQLVLTPWRSIALPGLEAGAAQDVADELESAGLVLSEHAPERSVSACIGKPGCAKSRADVRADVTDVMRAAGGAIADSGVAAHFSGCERRCGRPATDNVDVLADGNGYRVDGDWIPVEQLAEAVTRAVTDTAKGTGRDGLHPRRG